MLKLIRWSACLATLALGACAHAPADDPADPLEPVNRVVWTFNDTADRYVLRPVARAYVYVTPDFFRTGVTNFVENIEEPRTIVNDLFQLKLAQGGSDLGRFIINTTAGLGGVLDVATGVGLSKHDEDFGQTLGYWGVGEGWYLMLPLLGPSDNRDLVGTVVDIPTNPIYWLDGDHDWLKYSFNAVHIVNTRARLLDSDRLLDSQLDKYLFVRTAYLQRRQSMVYDGNPPKEDYEFEDGGKPAK